MTFPGQGNACFGCSLPPVHPYVSVAEKLFYLNSLNSLRPTFGEPELSRRPIQYTRRCSCPESPCSPFVSTSSVWGCSGARSASSPHQRRPNRDPLAIIENLARRRRSCAPTTSINSTPVEAKRSWKGAVGRKNQIGASAISRKVCEKHLPY